MVIDNALDKDLFLSIKNTLFDENFIWDYWPMGKIYLDYDATYDWFYDEESKKFVNKSPNSDAFFHMAMINNNCISEVGKLCEKAILQIAEKNNFIIKNILRIRPSMLLKNIKNYVNMPHVDDIVSHKVGILYLNDCDGETALYNQKYEQLERNKDYKKHLLIPEKYKKIISSGGFSFSEKVSSKENRFLIFDGDTFHSSVSPTNVSKRVVINFNFEIY